MAKQRLTKEQIDKFYGEYVKVKAKNYAGDIMSVDTWKNDVETRLYMLFGDTKWSNTKIREVSIQAAKRHAWTDKQIEQFHKALEVDEDLAKAFAEEFSDTNVGTKRFVENNQGLVYAFLQGYSGNWNQYFNS